MPSVDPSTWFDSDTGDGQLPRRRPRQADGFADPTFSYAVPATVPAGAPCWDVQPAALTRRRWLPAAEPATQPFPDAAGLVVLSYLDTSAPIRRRPWIAATDSPAFGLLPPGMTAASAAEQFASQQPDNTLRRTSRRLPVAEDTGRVWFFQAIIPPPPIYFGESPPLGLARTRCYALAGESITPMDTGTPTPTISWGTGDGSRPNRARRSWIGAESPLVLLVGVSDIGVPLIDGRDDGPNLRPRNPVFRAQEMTGLPPLVTLDAALWDAATLAMLPALVRARRWQAAAPEDGTATLWQAWLISMDTQGRMTWDVQHNYPRLPRRTALADPGAVPILDLSIQSVPWLASTDGSRQQTRQTWRASLAESMCPEAIALALPSAILVAGPYYVTAAQLWQAGPVDAQIETAD